MKNFSFKARIGFTLVELIIVIAISAIVFAGIYPMLTFGNNTFNSGTKQNNIQSSIRMLSDVITDSVKYSSDVKIITGTYTPDTFVETTNPNYGYDYIYLQYSGTDGIAVKKLSFNTSTNSYNESTIITRGSSSVVYNLLFKSGGTGSNVLAFDMNAVDGSKQYTLNTNAEIMNAALGTLDFSGTGHAIMYKTNNILVSPNVPPTAAPVTITGIPNVGQVLTGNYTYYDADGDSESSTSFKWYRKDPSEANWTEIIGQTMNTYTVTSVDLGKVLCFEVTPKALSGILNGLPEKSDATTTVTNLSIPSATDVVISGNGNIKVGKSLSAIYTYVTAGTAEGNSIYTWYRSSPSTGVTVADSGTKTYVLKDEDENFYIYFTVEPKDTNGVAGSITKSNVLGPINK